MYRAVVGQHLAGNEFPELSFVFLTAVSCPVTGEQNLSTRKAKLITVSAELVLIFLMFVLDDQPVKGVSDQHGPHGVVVWMEVRIHGTAPQSPVWTWSLIQPARGGFKTI